MKKFGLQLYTIRDRFQTEEDIRSSFRTIAEYGYTEGQTAGAFINPESFAAAAKDALSAVSDFTNDTLFASLGSKAEELSVKAGALLWCVRVAASGQAVTPGGATEILEVLGKEESLKRIDLALNKISQ